MWLLCACGRVYFPFPNPVGPFCSTAGSRDYRHHRDAFRNKDREREKNEKKKKKVRQKEKGQTDAFSVVVVSYDLAVGFKFKCSLGHKHSRCLFRLFVSGRFFLLQNQTHPI